MDASHRTETPLLWSALLSGRMTDGVLSPAAHDLQVSAWLLPQREDQRTRERHGCGSSAPPHQENTTTSKTLH